VAGLIGTIVDISERKQAEAAAKASEERFRATFDQAAVGIVHTSYEGNYLLVNQKFCDMLGYREYELVGRAAADFTHPDDRETSRQKRQMIWEGKLAGFTEEKRYLRKDGSVIWTNRTVSLARDATAKPLYFIRVIEDITQRKEAEERYRATFENAPVGIMHTAIDGYRILRANRKLCEMLGYTREELLGMTSTDVVHPDYRFTDRISYRQPILSNERQSFASERKFVRKDGSSLWVNRTVSLVRNAAGEPLYFIRIVEDITDRKQVEMALRDSEVRYRSVIAAIAEGVVLRDKDARILTCNASAERILGKTLEQMRGSMFYDSSWQAIREDGTPIPLDERPIRAALRTGQLQSNVVQGLRKPDGTVLWLSMNVQPLFDESDTTLTGVVSTLTDITERKQAELRQRMEHAITRILAEAVAPEDAMPKIIQTICETMEWHCGARWVWDKEALLLRCGEMWGIDTPEIREFITASASGTISPEPAGQGLVRRTYASGQPIWIADVTQVKGLIKRASMVAKAGLHGAFGFPLLLGGEVLGVMEFFHRDVRAPDALLLRIAESIGNQIGQFMARKQAEERIRHLANYDELTGLPNRSMFRERLHHALAQAQRHARPLAVLFIDLDFFKNINDTLGHEAGDHVLRDVAERLRGCLRDSDTVGRLGGDEFVVLLEGLPQLADVASVAQKILDAAARPFILAAQEFRIGASIGISAYPGDGKDLQTLLKHADAAMYRAKEQGRNNYQFYSPPG
ncbi:MAG: PAS domain S-box protein, partial [Betaproteobacteria bacterium]|nr:PAS domain S-box protein [Betaproteobacteria bacterium]